MGRPTPGGGISIDEVVRNFIVRTVLQDQAAKGLKDIVQMTQGLTAQATTVHVNANVEPARMAVKNLSDSLASVNKVDTRSALGGIRGLRDNMGNLTKTTQAAGDSIGNFFNKLDAGRLIVAGAAAGMVAFARTASQAFESFKLHVDTIQSQLGTSAGGLMSFIGAGGQEAGTSKTRRADLLSYMSMTGYRDQDQMKSMAANAEKIISSTFGQGLKEFGIGSEKDLLKALSNPMDENSDLGRIIKSKVPEYFKANTLADEKIKVSQEDRFQFQSDAVIEAEARRRMASKAMETISGGVEVDTDSYRTAARDMANTFEELRTSVGESLAPIAVVIMNIVNAFMKLVSFAPDVSMLASIILVLGVSFASLGALLPMVTAGFTALKTAMLTNPVFLLVAAFVVLGYALLQLEAKFKVFSNAWEYFKKSAIGSDLINWFKSLKSMFSSGGEGGGFFGGLIKAGMAFTAVIRGAFDKIDNIYKMFKGGDLMMGALGGGLKLALAFSPVGMAIAFAESQLPLKRVQEEALHILKQLKALWDRLIAWLRDVWESIVGLMSPLKGIWDVLKTVYDVLVSIKEKLFGKSLTGDEMKAALMEAFKNSKYPDLTRLTPKQSDWLSDYVMGKEVEGTNIDMGITGSQIRLGKKAYQDLQKETSPPLIEMPPSMVEADKRVAEIGKDMEEKGNEAIENKSMWGYLKNQYSGGFQAIGEVGKGLIGIVFPKNAVGGEVTKSGMAWVDEGEPIVPAEVSRSSVLIDRLREVSSSPATPSTIQINLGGITVNTAGASGYEIGRQVADEIERKFNDFAFQRKVEEIATRGNRAFIG